MKKILPFLLINVAVSALTMLAVILIWNAFHPSPLQKSVKSEASVTETAKVGASLPSLDQKTVEIQSVFMPGEMGYEKINLKNTGKQPVDLTGWRLENEKGDQYLFPGLTLFPEGAISVYSQAGANTPVELYWNASTAVWKSGSEAVLLDSAGQERSRYLIP